MKNSLQITKYDKVIEFLTKRMKMFNTDHLRLMVEAKGLDQCDDARDWARVLRSAAARGICKKTEIYQKSNLRSSNNIPRAMWVHLNEEAMK